MNASAWTARAALVKQLDSNQQAQREAAEKELVALGPERVVWGTDSTWYGSPQPLIDGFTQEQRFFIAWGQIWCETASEQDQRRRAREDPHSNGRWRTNGVLQNSEEFRKAFGCTTGQTAMAPERVCRVW